MACRRASDYHTGLDSRGGCRGSAPLSDSHERAVRCRVISMPWLHLHMLRGPFDPGLFVAGALAALRPDNPRMGIGLRGNRALEAVTFDEKDSPRHQDNQFRFEAPQNAGGISADGFDGLELRFGGRRLLGRKIDPAGDHVFITKLWHGNALSLVPR